MHGKERFSFTSFRGDVKPPVLGNPLKLAFLINWVIQDKEYIYIYIGYTMNLRGLRDLEPCGNLYKHPCAKRKGVYGFQGVLNPIGPEGSSYKVFIL